MSAETSGTVCATVRVSSLEELHACAYNGNTHGTARRSTLSSAESALERHSISSLLQLPLAGTTCYKPGLG